MSERLPTAEDALRVLDYELASTQELLTRWLGGEDDSEIPRRRRDKLRAELYLQLDRLWLQGRATKQRVSEDHVKWARKRMAEDRHTTTVDGAAAFERHRAGHAGPW